MQDERASAGKRPGKRLSLWLRLAAGLALLVWICGSLDMREVGRLLLRVDPRWIAALAVVALPRPLLMAWKWCLLLRARGVDVPLWVAGRVYWISYLLGAVTPGGIGVEVYRVVALRGLGATDIIASSVVIERLIGMIVVLAVALLTLPLAAGPLGAATSSVALVLGAFAVALLGLMLVSFRPGLVEALGRFVPARLPLIGRLRKLYRAYAEFRFHRRTLAWFTVLTVFELAVLVTAGVFAVRSVVAGTSWIYVAGFLPVMHILLRLPITIQGIGVQEGLLIFFLAGAGIPAEAGLAVSLLLRVAEIVLLLVPAALIWWLAPGVPRDVLRSGAERG